MSCSSPCAGRRKALAWLLAAPTAALAQPASARPPELPPELPADWAARGRARLRFLGLAVYEAQLWSPEPLRVNSWHEQPLALTLNYQRRLKGGLIAERSLKEMRRQGPIDEAQAQAWLAGMREAFPDVDDGQRISGRHEPAQGARFWFNGSPRAPSFDAAFSRRFFGIWLAPQTSEPEMRAQLLGLSP
jgi:hypothetical protein